MASNFKIYSFKTGNSLHLKLTGDFDGSSAYELINTIVAHGKGLYEIFINTDDLNNIYPYGTEVFEKKFGALKKQFHGINFIGRNGHSILTN
jgi:hypothetical protein